MINNTIVVDDNIGGQVWYIATAREVSECTNMYVRRNQLGRISFNSMIWLLRTLEISQNVLDLLYLAFPDGPEGPSWRETTQEISLQNNRCRFVELRTKSPNFLGHVVMTNNNFEQLFFSWEGVTVHLDLLSNVMDESIVTVRIFQGSSMNFRRKFKSDEFAGRREIFCHCFQRHKEQIFRTIYCRPRTFCSWNRQPDP